MLVLPDLCVTPYFDYDAKYFKALTLVKIKRLDYAYIAHYCMPKPDQENVVLDSLS